MSERRNDDRIAFRIPAHIHLGHGQQLYKGYVLNLSEHGAFVMMDQAVPLSSEISLRFELDGTPHLATGRLAHVIELGNGQGFGIELTSCSPDYDDFVRSLGSASDSKLMTLIRDMKRIQVTVGR